MFFENLFKPFDADAIARFGEFGTMFGNHIYKIGALTKKYQGMDFALKPQLRWKYKSFTDTTERLAKIADPFTKFVKAFGDMAKHMGVFATNFKVMDFQGIMAFKDWTDSITTISKVDLSKSSAILDFAKGVVDNAFPAGNSKEVGDKFILAKNRDRAYKPKGYKFPCTVVSVFKTVGGDVRVVAEMEGYGLLHIFNEEQLEQFSNYGKNEEDSRIPGAGC